MARSRNIKPSFFQNEQLGELDPLDRIAFIGLWTVADFKGCVELRPKRLKVQLLPYDDCDFEKIAINLDKSGLIRNYSVQGKRYIKIINFERHQNPHKNERDAGSEIPDINDGDTQVIDNNELSINLDKSGLIRNSDGTNPASSLFPIPDSLIPLPETTEKKCASAHAEDDEKITAEKKQGIPYQQIIDTYHATLPTLAQVYKLTDLRKSRIKNLCHEELEEVKHWENYFKSISRSDFLMGRAPPDIRTGRTFAADFDFIINPTNFVKIAEGKYHEKKIQRR